MPCSTSPRGRSGTGHANAPPEPGVDERFDITSGVLRHVWNFDGSANVPRQIDIDTVRQNIGWSRVAWHRPDQFHKVLSFIGSYTTIRGGDRYPQIVMDAEKKPIRVRRAATALRAWSVSVQSDSG